MVQKILIIKLSALGDVVHTLPALHALRASFPEARIDWLVGEGASSLLKDHPLLNRVHIFKNSWRRNFFHHIVPDIIPFFRVLRKENFDWAIDFQGLTKSGVAAYFSRARKVIGFGDKDGRELNKLFTNVKIIPPSGLHIVEKNLCLLKPLEITNPRIAFPLPNFKQAPTELPVKDYIIVNPGAGWKNKILPTNILGELCSLIFKETGWEIVIAWGPREESLAKEVFEAIKQRGAKSRIAPKTSIPQLVCLIQNSRMFLGGDTGPTHLAAALKIPVVSWFGPSDSRRNGPYGPACSTIQKFDLSCVPCWKKNCRYKGKRRQQCLKSISTGELFLAARNLFEKKSP